MRPWIQLDFGGSRESGSAFPTPVFLLNRKLCSLLSKNAPLWMRTPRLRKLVADATALRRECAQERTLFHNIEAVENPERMVIEIVAMRLYIDGWPGPVCGAGPAGISSGGKSGRPSYYIENVRMKKRVWKCRLQKRQC